MTKNSPSIVRGALFVIASELSFALGAAIIKLLSESFPNESIVFFRNFFGLMILTPLLLRNGTEIFKTDCWHLHLIRAGFGIGAMYCFFYAIANLSLGNTMLLKSTIPLIIPFVSAFWLQEKISQRIILAGILGFLGVFLILQPDGETNWASLVALLSSVMAAIAFVTVGKLAETEPTLRIVSFFAIFGLGISAIPLIWSWQTPTLNQCFLLMGVGLAATMGQFLLTRGYHNAPASSVGIFTYTSVIFGSFLGWLFWQDLLDMNYLFGAILIVLAGSIVLRSRYCVESQEVKGEDFDGG